LAHMSRMAPAYSQAHSAGVPAPPRGQQRGANVATHVALHDDTYVGDCAPV